MIRIPEMFLWSLMALGLAIVACDPKLPPGDLVLYEDALGNGWENWSWDCGCFESTDYVHTGRRAFAVSLKPYGGLGIGRHGPIRTKQYSNLEFYINGGKSGGQQLRVSINDRVGDGERPPTGISINNPRYIENGTIEANKWKLVSIPLADLGADDTTLVKVNVMDDKSGKTQPTFYVDNMKLIARRP